MLGLEFASDFLFLLDILLDLSASETSIDGVTISYIFKICFFTLSVTVITVADSNPKFLFQLKERIIKKNPMSVTPMSL